MSVDISVSITEDIVDIIATPTVNIVNVTNSASIDPSLYDLSEFTNTSPNPFVRTSGLSSYVPTSRTLTINGTTQDLSADRTFTISTGITIGTTAIASGTVGRVLFEGTGNVVQESANLFWDNTGFLGIGTSTPVAPSTYNGITINSASAGAYVWFQTGGVTKYTVGSEGNINYHNLVAGTSFLIRSGGNNYFNVVQSTGNVQIGTTTDAGFRLDVNGTARVSETITSNLSSANWDLGTYNILDLQRNGSSRATLKSNGTFSWTSGTDLTINSGGGTARTVLSSVNSEILAVANQAGIDYNARFSQRAGKIALRVLGISGTTQNLFEVLTGASVNAFNIFSSGNIGINTTTDAGFRLDVNGTARVQTSLEIAGATGVTLGGGASALAYSGNVLNIGNSASWTDIRLFAGGVQKFSQTSSLTTIANTTINLSTATVQLAGVNALTYLGTDIRIGSVAAGFNSLSMYVAGSERARIASTGNLLINTTTDAGFRLDVNGTARVQGAFSVQGPNSSFIDSNNNIYGARLEFNGGRFYINSSEAVINGRPFYVGPANVNASAIIQADSSTRGFLPPRQTQAQRTAIASPAVGLIVYQTDLIEGLYIYKSTGWTFIV